MFSSVCFGEWTEVSKNVNGDTYYVDFDSIKQEDGYLYYWELQDWIKSEMGDLSGKYYTQVDCNLFRFKRLSVIGYKESMGQGDLRSNNTPDENWKYSLQDSSIEYILQTVCEFVKDK